MKIDLDRLERLIKAARPLPWHNQSFEVYGWKNKRRVFIAQTSKPIMQGIENIVQRLHDADYIVAACNSLPDLIAENRTLRERVRELEEYSERLNHEAACLIGSFPTMDCRHCDYSSWCGRDETRIEPDFDICKAAILNFCKPDSEDAGK